jgi:altronate dehydratase
MKEYLNVDGVIALTHNGGCGQRDYELLQRTLSGIAKHPNVADAILVGLGCEGNQMQDFSRESKEKDLIILNQPRKLEIQAMGGSQKTIQEGIELVKSILPKANRAQRSSQPISNLVVALECGGSDSWSGITANPLVGRVSDTIVQRGGTIVLSETPEVFGAEHLLLNRSNNSEVRERLLGKLSWWQDYVNRIGASLEDNPSPGNKAGGLTNICEKSLGAITKSGTTPLMAVYDYAEMIQATGFVFMDSPGNDPVSITGMVAGGCNLVLFTTGRGSVFGFKPTPSIKICSNSKTYLHMIEDMDFDAGRILEDGETIENLSEELFELMITIASGKKPKSESLGLGEIEFVPWFREGFL